MKNINVFYHIFLVNCNNAELLIDQQVEKLFFLKSKNDKINFYVNITNNNGFVLSDNLLKKLEKLTNNISYTSNNLYELSTLNLLQEHAINNPNNYYLYFHTKGITRINDKDDGKYSYKNVENWRNIMEHFCIEKFEICLEELETNDIVGCNYIPSGTMNVPAHYSGNFWWSKSKFIVSLPKISNYYINNNNIDRFNAEFWVGQSPHNAVCLYPIPKPIFENHNRCFTYTNESEYKNNIIKSYFKNY
jgi:hypothetical protein